MAAATATLPKPAQRILKAATSLFARKGLAGTTTRMIASRAKMNEALIFRYFPTKNHLYAAILQCQMDSEKFIQDFQGEVPSLEFFLKSLAARILENKRRKPQFIRLMYFSALEGHKLASTVYERAMHSIVGFIAEKFDAAIARGELRPIDTHLAARSFIGMVGHHALVSEVFNFDADRWSDDELVANFTSIFLEGLKARNVK
jgi:AcrR family transcriptional regulator